MIEQVSIDKIKPSPYQPRLTFDLEDIKGSVQKDGILVALTVRKKDGFYELVDGERRVRLAKELGYKNVKCDIIDVDDDVARRMVWKVNTLRKDYTTQEKAYHFKKLQEQGMSLRGIATDCDYSDTLIRAYLAVFGLPQQYQSYVWLGKIGVGHLIELLPLFNGGTAKYLARILEHLDMVMDKKLGQKELREVLNDDLKELERKRVESAKKAVGKITPDGKEPKTPDELDKAAEVLKREANRKRDAKLTSEEKAKRKAEEQRKKVEKEAEKERKKKEREAEKQRKQKEKKAKEEEKKRQEEEKHKKREEQIRKEAEESAKEKLLHDKQFIKDAAKIASSIQDDEQKVDLPFDIPSVDSQLDKVFSAMAKIKPTSNKEGKQGTDFVVYIRSYLTRKKIVCPICGESYLQWKCGHDF